MLFDANLELKEVFKFVVGDTVVERLVHFSPGLGCSKLGKDNPGLARKKIRLNFFLSKISLCDALKRTQNFIPKRLLNKGIKKPGFKVNLGLALIGL